METRMVERKSVRKISRLDKATTTSLWAICDEITEMLKEVGIKNVVVKEHSDEDATATTITVLMKWNQGGD
jgi:hypothetical protein